MDFALSEQDEAFRQEVRTFIQENLPEGWKSVGWESDDDEPEAVTRFVEELIRKRWHVLAWPKEYGGLEANFLQQLVYNEEMALAGAPGGNVWAGVQLAGPVLMIHGTEEQKKRFLPGISDASDVWAQGFSEPNAGSDLASLQTRAVRDGDEYIINGQKIWTSSAQSADWCILLARTDPDAPKHRGISYFLVDMRSPGFTVRPIADLSGGQPFNELFFEDVRVPAQNLLGELNRGWYVAATTLDFERSGVGSASTSARELRTLAEAIPTWPGDGLNAGAKRLEMADTRISVEVARLLAYRVASMQARGLVPNYEASISKLFGSEIHQALTNTMVNVRGLYGQLLAESPHEEVADGAARSYMFSVQETIAAGTSEIQRNVIATRGLGLPRG